MEHKVVKGLDEVRTEEEEHSFGMTRLSFF